MPIVQTTPTSNIPDVYVLPVASPKSVGPVPSDIVALVGESNRGLPDSPTWIGSPAEFKSTFGGIQPNPTNTQVPLSGYPSYLHVAQQGAQDVMFVRVGNAQLAASYITIKSGSNLVLALWAATPGTWGQNLAAVVGAGPTATTFSLTVTNSTTGESDVWASLDYTNNANLINAINASAKLVFATQPVVDVPAQQTFSGTGTGGTGLAGWYYGIVTYTNAAGETVGSPESGNFQVTGSQSIAVTIPTMTGATAANIYLTPLGGAQGVGAGTETLAKTGCALGSQTLISAAWTVSTVTPPFGPKNLSGTVVAATTGAGYTAAIPTAGTTAYPTAAATGVGVGNDGANASSSRHVGVAGTPSTGLYALTGLQPHPNFVFLAGTPGTDTTQWATQAQIASDNNWVAVVALPSGTSVSTAQTTVAALTSLLGSYTANRIKVGYPGVQYYEGEYFLKNLLATGQGFYAGISAVQSPNTSAGNKPLTGAVAAEFALSRSQVSSLITNRINPLWAGIPLKGIGYSTDYVLSGDDCFDQRMQGLLADALFQVGGQWVQVPNTPTLWQAAHDVVQNFLDGLAKQGLIPSNPPGVSTPTTSSSAGTTTAAGSAAGTQPSTANAQGTSGTQLQYVVVCNASNNVINGVTSKNLIIDVQCNFFPNTVQALIRITSGVGVAVTLTPA